MTTLTIMRILPREVDPMVFNMIDEGDMKNKVSFTGIGGLGEEIRQLREVIELPLINPELFIRVGIKAPKGVLLYGPPGLFLTKFNFFQELEKLYLVLVNLF
jgi:26S proteasome regulatory subunit T4